MKFITIPLFLLMWGCSTPAEVVQRTIDNVIRIDTVRVIQNETQFDTVWIDNGQGQSVKYIVRVDTLWKKVYVKSKADTIYIPVIDTIKIVETKVVESSDWTFEDKFWAVLTILGVILLITVLRK